MTGEELNILSKIKVRPVEEQRDYLLEQNMLLTGKIATLEKENEELKKSMNNWLKYEKETQYHKSIIKDLKKENVELKRIVKMVAMINKGIYTNEGIKAIYEEAEQFISEVEKCGQ